MRLVFDLETNGLLGELDKVWCICAHDIDTGQDYSYNVHDCNIIEGLWLLQEADELIGHNIIGFDLFVLEKLYGLDLFEKATDTYVLSRLLNPDRERPHNTPAPTGCHGLAAWGYRIGRGKPEHNDWSQYSEAMLHRCREDVAINAQVYDILIQEMVGSNWKRAIENEYKVQRIITQQELNGVAFDVELGKSTMKVLTDEINIHEAKILELVHDKPKSKGVTVNEPYTKAGLLRKTVRDWYTTELINEPHLIGGPFDRVEWSRFNPNSQPQIKELLFSLGWVPDEWNYKDGQRTSPKLTESSFESIAGQGVGEAIKRRVMCTHRRNQLKGFFERLDDRGRVSAGANTIGTNTNRFRHHGLVNIPSEGNGAYMGKEFRSMFYVPDPDWRMIGYDADQLELRMLAHYMNDEGYIHEITRDGADIHTHNQRLAGLNTRAEAKTFIYAFNYGAGDYKLGTICGGGQEEGTAARKRFLRENPALDRLLRNVKRASNKGYLRGLDGRRLYMRYSEGRVMQHKALNTLLQGAGAVVMKYAMVWLDEMIRAEGLAVRKLIDMHDESQLEVHKKDLDRVVELCKLCVVKAGEQLGLRLPLKSEVKVGRNWSQTH